MIIDFMDEINKAYNEYYEYMNNFIRTTYSITEQDKKDIQQLNKEKEEINKGIEQLNKEKDKMNKKIQELTKKNMILLEKENESTNLILKLDKTIADLRNELRKAKKI